jgi:outer membrane receptor protein involved in Fe transport
LREDLGETSIRGDYNYVSEYFTSYFNRSLATTAPYADNIPAHDNLNARLTWRNPDRTWQADFFVQNLTENADLVHQNPTYHNAGLNFVVYTRPRTFGARLSHRF